MTREHPHIVISRERLSVAEAMRIYKVEPTRICTNITHYYDAGTDEKVFAYTFVTRSIRNGKIHLVQ